MEGLKEIDVERTDILSKVDIEYLYGKLKSFQITGEEAKQLQAVVYRSKGYGGEYYED